MTAQFPKFEGLAGAAFRLHMPSKIDTVLTHPDGLVTLRAEAPYVTVQLNTPHSRTDLRANAWQVIQETLDIYAATHRQALATYRGEQEYLLWSQSQTGYELTIVDTLHAKWEFKATATVHPPHSVAPTSASIALLSASHLGPTVLPHHASFRFLRMSLLSEDLFDAYRNAYLALECLVSDVSAKLGSEGEAVWLLRVLRGPLAPAIPGGIDLESSVERIYKNGRLPLFHAKTGNSYHLPHGSQRAEVQETLALLNLLLTSIVHHKFGAGFPGGWARYSKKVIDGMARVSFEVDEVVFVGATTRESTRPIVSVHDTPRRFGNIWASLDAAPPSAIDKIHSLELRLDGEDRIFLTLSESLRMEGVCAVRLELNQIESRSVRAPTPLHPM